MYSFIRSLNTGLSVWYIPLIYYIHEVCPDKMENQNITSWFIKTCTNMVLTVSTLTYSNTSYIQLRELPDSIFNTSDEIYLYSYLIWG